MNRTTFTSWDGTLIHYGTKGQRWGIRKYQNPDGTLTEEGKKRYYNSDGKLSKEGLKTFKREAKALARNEYKGKQLEKDTLKVGKHNAKVGAAGGGLVGAISGAVQGATMTAPLGPAGIAGGLVAGALAGGGAGAGVGALSGFIRGTLFHSVNKSLRQERVVKKGKEKLQDIINVFGEGLNIKDLDSNAVYKKYEELFNKQPANMAMVSNNKVYDPYYSPYFPLGM